MEIKLTEQNSDKVLVIKGNGTVKEDNLIEKWHSQIMGHLEKLNLKVNYGGKD